jgi:predicted short-subunit dehydrogenase-like oxidoreductase (DUF2520 family)
MKIVFIGAGNLATRLSMEMHRVGMTIGQVYSPTRESASSLASKLGCAWTTDMAEVADDAGLYIFSVKDAALEDVLSRMKPNGGLWVHTAGGVPMDIFKPYTSRYGVFYPLQTFSKERAVSFEHVPLLLEACREEDKSLLQEVASALSDTVSFLSSEKRKSVHLAAVFASNFTNHMYTIAAKLLEEQGISYRILLPSIEETALKLRDLPPVQAQTGPAVRYDTNIMEAQSALLTNERYRELYHLISRSIHIETDNNE